MIRAVIDTNVILSAVIKPEGKVGEVLRLLGSGEYRFVFSEQLIAEIIDVLNRPRIKNKYGINSEDIETVLALLFLRGEAVAPVKRVEVYRDPKDNMLLEAAIEGRVDMLVSGDKDLLDLGRFEDIPIEPPAAFLRRFSGKQ